MIKKFNFTQARIRALPLPEKGRVDYLDTIVPKLVCRVSSTGNKSFIVTKRIDGKLKNVTIGKFVDVPVIEARRKAQVILAELNSGIDPVAKKRKQKSEKVTLEEVLEQYLQERKLKPITKDSYRYKLKHSFKAWLNKPINNITDKMVLKRHKELSKVGATTANTSMRVLRLTMNYARAIGLVDEPATKILSEARVWHKPKRKDRVIPSTELKAWYEAVEALPNQKAKVYLLVALYMGLRSKEVLALEWSHVDLTRKVITLYDTKNGTNRTLPIPNALVPFMESLFKLTGRSKWVFLWSKPTGKKNAPDKPMTTPKRSIAAVIKRSGVEFSPHDCRRTFATIAEAVSLPLTMIKRLMNHTTTNDVTGGYIITEEETLRAATNKVASYITGRVSSEDNVIKLNIVS
jgi:integrase